MPEEKCENLNYKQKMNKGTPKISVIIPVYNAAPFIDECIKSLLVQTLSDCEFIFINDGSKDNSTEIIESYTDSRIILINQLNQGISMARNAGVNAATGEYIGFLDNDDYIKSDMLEILYTTANANDLDIVVSKTILGRDGKFIIKDSVYPVDEVYETTFIQQNIVPDLLKREDLFAVWNKIYKRELIEKYKVRFPENRNIEEDSMFNLQAFNKASKIIFLDYSGYYYRDVIINESRKIIERDYFERAVERYHFDYKNVIGLDIEDEKLKLLKSLRLIHRVFYLIFRCSIEKKYDVRTLQIYIRKMVSHADVREIASKYSAEELEVNGHFQKLLFTIIKKQSLKKLSLVSKLVRLVYSPKLSEILRSLNKKQT